MILRFAIARGGTAQLEFTPRDTAHVTLGVDMQTNQHAVRSSMNQTASPYAAMPHACDARFEQRGGFGEAGFTLAGGRRVFAGVGRVQRSPTIGS